MAVAQLSFDFNFGSSLRLQSSILFLGRLNSSLVVFGQTRLLRQKTVYMFCIFEGAAAATNNRHDHRHHHHDHWSCCCRIAWRIKAATATAACLDWTGLSRPSQTQRRVCRVSPSSPHLSLLPLLFPFASERCIVPSSMLCGPFKMCANSCACAQLISASVCVCV